MDKPCSFLEFLWGFLLIFCRHHITFSCFHFQSYIHATQWTKPCFKNLPECKLNFSQTQMPKMQYLMTTKKKIHLNLNNNNKPFKTPD